MNTVGLDIGRCNTKLYTGYQYVVMPSFMGEWRQLKLTNKDHHLQYEGVYKGKKFFAGLLAQEESEFSRQMLVDNKATQDALLLSLVSLHLTGMNDFDIVTGLPVDNHSEESKQQMIDLLEGVHHIEIEGTQKEIRIERVRVAVEGGGGFWSKPEDGLVRLLDGGGKTFDYVTLNNRRYVDRDSGTVRLGFDTNKTSDIEQLIARIAGELGSKWEEQDKVYTLGGMAEPIAYYMKKYFPKTRPLFDPDEQERPPFAQGVSERQDNNLFANAIGYYNIGRVV